MFTPRKCHTVKKLASTDLQSVKPACKQVQEAIMELGWTLADAAEFLGKSKETIWRWSNGLATVDADALIKLTVAAWGTSSVRIVRSATG